MLRDANNNVIALTDAEQQIRTQYSYEPYGPTTYTGAADVNTQQYTGRENDGTGLYDYRNRYYSLGLQADVERVRRVAGTLVQLV